jgi:hypothetical protein
VEFIPRESRASMRTPPDNRAVSALFRVFGGEGETVVADARELADRAGMHGGECAVFAFLIPLTVLIAIGEGLVRGLGVVAGCVLAFPATFVALNLLPFLLGAKRQRAQWFLWLLALVIWAVSRRGAGGVVGLMAYVWIGVAVLNFAAGCVLDGQAAMGLTGKRGVFLRISGLILMHGIALGIGFKFGWPWAVGAGAGIGGAVCAAVLRPGCQWLGPVYRTTDFSGILVTIDDGPDPEDTPVLLDLLDLYQTKAIFFMIGEKVRAHPELAREVVKRGHEIGNHTMTHPQASFWCAGPWRTRREIRECQQVVKDATGITPRWFRAPVGHRNLFTHPVARALGLRVMAWNRRGYDAVETDATKVLARILPDLGAGDIVLLHEATPIAGNVLAGVLAAAKRGIPSRS